MGKRGAIYGTVTKLISIILILVVMVTVIWGFYNTSHPVVQVMVGQFDKVILVLGFGGNEGESSDCEVYNVSKRVGGDYLKEVYGLVGRDSQVLQLVVCELEFCGLLDGDDYFRFSEQSKVRKNFEKRGGILVERRGKKYYAWDKIPGDGGKILKGVSENAYFYWKFYWKAREAILEKMDEWENLPTGTTDYIMFFGDDADSSSYAYWNAGYDYRGNKVDRWIIYGDGLSGMKIYDDDSEAIEVFAKTTYFDELNDKVYYSVSSSLNFPKDVEIIYKEDGVWRELSSKRNKDSIGFPGYAGEDFDLNEDWEIESFKEAFGKMKRNLLDKSKFNAGNADALNEIYSKSDSIVVGNKSYHITVTKEGKDLIFSFSNGSEEYWIYFGESSPEENLPEFLLFRPGSTSRVNAGHPEDNKIEDEEMFKEALLHKAILEFLEGQCG